MPIISYRVSRRVIIPNSEDRYLPFHYEHTKEITYSEEEVEENTIIDSNEFDELLESVDEAQRKAIKKDLSITDLPMDTEFIINKRKSRKKIKD
jgi:hypothetical protein